MEIVAKSIINKDHLDAKVKDETNKIEIQLLKDFFDDDNTVDKLFEETLKSDVVVYNVHAPLVDGEDFNLEYFSQPEAKKIFIKCCELSQRYANHYKRNINIILHNGFNLNTYKNIPILLDEIVKIFEFIIEKYPNINITFENIIPFSLKDDFYTRNGFITENVSIAKYFNKVCSKPIFRTTLDTCHMLTTLKYLEIFKDEPKFTDRNINIEYFFEANKDTINNIH
ncbi:MAG: hypothetical protein GX995_09605, partial [Clostridiales bacterium]|nr:hypothetical protein [Clostridiales bacterium]